MKKSGQLYGENLVIGSVPDMKSRPHIAAS
jgi:hypothetical protein